MVKFLLRLMLWVLLLILTLQLWYLANVVIWVSHNPSSTSFMDLRLRELRVDQPDAQLQHSWVPYEQISNHLKQAVIAAEDSGFVEHFGVEWEAIESAFERNLKKGKVTHGGSTITQQLAKNLFLSPKKSYFRKAQELVIALMIEVFWDKRRILEVYLNVVEWGDGVFGAQAASMYYFDKNASELSAYQAARLASKLPSPRYFDKNRDSAFLARKITSIKSRMHMVVIP
jgi:monofunctional glycosyltransferase